MNLRASIARTACVSLAFALAGVPAAPVTASNPALSPLPAQDDRTLEEPGAILLRAPAKGAASEQWIQNGGREGRWVRNVTTPTLTPFLPAPGKATGVAVIVAPGGGFRFLSIDNEGYRVARFLADRGIAAFVLKYRTVPTLRGPNWLGPAMRELMSAGVRQTQQPLEATPEAVEDAQAAVRLVRTRASEWKVDPEKVGLIGFSAGAMTALSTGLGPDKASRPDFIGTIYGAMGPRPVAADAPPLFAAIALDDPLFAVNQPLGLIDSWRQAKRPVEAHLYERGQHGFGMTATAAAAALWSEQFVAWLKDRKLLQ